jgi:hypothetical protein
MIYFEVLGHKFLILGSLERAYDIFERRSSNYSSRPRLVMMNEMFVKFDRKMRSGFLNGIFLSGPVWITFSRSNHTEIGGGDNVASFTTTSTPMWFTDITQSTLILPGHSSSDY